ncbi:MAG: Stf0 sulfotransferase family protein [Rhodobacteraceae bacterium]|jgi:LPS sulfotransferase NodH|nr:Stf0 sulfotransferase family protein [Paracoccaceae bacterium]
MDGYILCATPRSGSTLLCELLAATGVAGEPDSYFMDNVDPVWARRWGLPARNGQDEAADARSFVDAVLKAGRGKTPVFGLRLMNRNFGDVLTMIDRAFPGLATDSARLRAAFGDILFVHLARRDRLAQAVSLVKAEQTGLWHVAPDGTEVERLAPPRPPAYDFDRIAATLADLEAQDAGWTAWFAAEGITPFPLWYEELSADPAGAVVRICRELGTPAPDQSRLEPTVARLADATSADWIRRFRADAVAQA